jgi:hypothetical protein
VFVSGAGNFVMLADFVLAIHVLLVLFNVGGVLAIVAGGLLRWRWVRHRGFRLAHVSLMAVVTAEALLGISCPLTMMEDWLRGAATEQSFVQRWAGALIYWSAPPWVFAAIYAAVLVVLIAAWWLLPPYASKRQSVRG